MSGLLTNNCIVNTKCLLAQKKTVYGGGRARKYIYMRIRKGTSYHWQTESNPWDRRQIKISQGLNCSDMSTDSKISSTKLGDFGLVT